MFGDVMAPNELQRIRETLINGLRLSKQGSYSRRAPAAEAVPFLRAACAELSQLIQQQPNNAEAWKLLALGFEAQLDYRRAVDALQKYLELVPNAPKEDRKRLALCRQYLQEWKSLSLAPESLEQLGNYLRTVVRSDPSRDFRHTLAWLKDTGHDDPEAVLQGMRDRGAFDDWQVLQNLVIG